MNSRTKLNRAPIDILRSLITDIDAMQNPREVYAMGFSDENDSDHQPRDFFGPFCAYTEADEGGVSMVEGGNGVSVEWPNLRILLEEAKAALEAA